MNKYIKQLTESLFDDIDDIFSDDDENMEILASLEDVYLPYVDLGLTSGTLWYKCNLGAKHDYESGLYFQWGDTQGYKDATTKTFDWSDYSYCKGSANSLTKYCNDNFYEDNEDNKLLLDLMDDAAYVMTNKLAVTPTLELFNELYKECIWTWTSINNVNGYKILSNKNTNYIFLPVTGYCTDNKTLSSANLGYYWSSSIYSYYCYRSYYCGFDPIYILTNVTTYRCRGFSIRPVIKNKYNKV